MLVSEHDMMMITLGRKSTCRRLALQQQLHAGLQALCQQLPGALQDCSSCAPLLRSVQQLAASARASACHCTCSEQARLARGRPRPRMHSQDHQLQALSNQQASVHVCNHLQVQGRSGLTLRAWLWRPNGMTHTCAPAAGRSQHQGSCLSCSPPGPGLPATFEGASPRAPRADCPLRLHRLQAQLLPDKRAHYTVSDVPITPAMHQSPHRRHCSDHSTA